MAVTSNIFTISYSGEPGDGSYSLLNRYIYALKEKLLEHGFNMVYENSVTDINTQAKQYLLSLDGVSGVLLFSTLPYYVYAYVGIINGNGINPRNHTATISVSGNAGVSTFNCFFSNNFFFLKKPTVDGDPFIMFFKTNYGWCPCTTSSSLVEINEQYYNVYRTPVGNNPGYLNLDNKHVLYSPSFYRQTVAGSSSTADRRLDDTIKYAGVAFQRPDTLTQLTLNTMYKINDTNETFYYGYPFELIYFD